MELNDFRRVFNLTNGFYITDDVVMFRNPLEFWNEKTEESTKYKNIDDALAHKINGMQASDIIANLDKLYLEPKVS